MDNRIDRLMLLAPLHPRTVRRLENAGACVDGNLVVCPAGTTYKLVQDRAVVLHFMDGDEPALVFDADEVRVIPYPA